MKQAEKLSPATGTLKVSVIVELPGQFQKYVRVVSERTTLDGAREYLTEMEVCNPHHSFSAKFIPDTVYLTLL